MANKIRPLHDRVLVERIEAESKTAGGIIIPDTAKEKPAEGKVVAVGEFHMGFNNVMYTEQLVRDRLWAGIGQLLSYFCRCKACRLHQDQFLVLFR